MNRPEARPSRLAVEYAERTLPDSRSSADALPDAAHRALRDLESRLTSVFGPAGCEVLFRRAVSRAAARHPILASSEAVRSHEGLVDLLRERIRPENAAEAAAAVRDVGAEQISLLTRFIGEDLVRTLLYSEKDRRPDARAEGEARADDE